MNYDYSSANKRLELPNPYRVENAFLFACAAIALVGGVTSLVWARNAFEAHLPRLGVAPVVIGVALVSAAVTFAAVAASRLRFFFGRGRPRSLADDLAPGTQGNSAGADYYKALLRQGGLEYPEPHGALNGLLYNAMPRLITAPDVVQDRAQRHFFNALALLATFLSFVFAYAIFGNETSRPLVSVAYFVFGVVVLLKPVVSETKAPLSRGPLVGLVVAAILGPVVIGLIAGILPPLHVELQWQTLTLLLCSLLAVGLILCALRAQVGEMPQTDRSCEQRTISLNGPPSSLITELDRLMQAGWSEGIPNRRYTLVEPVTQSARGSGQFTGELMEESQPLPIPGATPPTFSGALSSPRHAWLVLVDLCGCLLTLLGVVCALSYAREFDPARLLEGAGHAALVGFAAVFLAIAAFCFKSASEIWGRFNFESFLLWVEMNGAWQSSHVGSGNQLSSLLHTDNQVVRVESMTLRIWRARIESVAFGKDGRRQVTAMFGSSEEAARLASELERHVDRTSVFMGLTAEDRSRIGALRATESLLGSDPAAAPAALGAALGAALAPPRTGPGPAPGDAAPGPSPRDPAKARFCSSCGTAAGGGARFCTACGTPLASPG